MNAGIILFIGIVQGILFISHFVVYKAVIFFGNIDGKAALITKLSFLALSVFFMVGSIITAQGFTIIGRGIYTIAAIWLGILFWLFSMAVIGAIFWYLLSFILPTYTQYPQLKQSFGLLLLTIVIFVNLYGVINAQFVRTTKYNVVLKNLPVTWNNKKVVFFADNHYGNIWNKGTAKELVKKIQKIEPDLILISGDFYDGPKINFKEVADIFTPLAKSTPEGIYFVTGNHEEYQDKEMYLGPLRDAGFTILDSNSILINGLRIAGIGNDDGTTDEKQALALKKIRAEINAEKNEAYANSDTQTKAETSANLIENAPIIFLKHIPLRLQQVADEGIALTLAGHTHHGQIWPFSYITKKMYKGYDYGLKELGSMQVITTSGAGSWGPPQRFGTVSELVLINLSSPDNQ